MQQPLRSTGGALDPGEAVHRVPVIEKPVHDTLHRSTRRAACVLESLFAGPDEVLPMVIEDLVERIIAKDAGAISHGVHPAKVKCTFVRLPPRVQISPQSF